MSEATSSNLHFTICILHFALVCFRPCFCAVATSSTGLGRLKAVWGRLGISDGRFQTPRAITIDRRNRLYIVDKTARIQVFNTAGKFLRGWQTPVHAAGKPSGLAIGRNGNLLVADTHYFRMLIYSPAGKLLRTLGGVQGQKPGQFGFVTGVAQTGETITTFPSTANTTACRSSRRRASSCSSGAGTAAGPASSSARKNWPSTSGPRLGDRRLQPSPAGLQRPRQVAHLLGPRGSAPGKLYYPYDLILARTTRSTCVNTATIACRNHARRPVLGRVGRRRARYRAALQPLGPGPRQPRDDLRA